MADRIKGITVVIGGDVTGLNKALASTNKQINGTQKQLKDVERLLKLDPKNTELLVQRQRLLSEAVQETKKKLDALKKASENVTADDNKYEQWKQSFASIQGQINKTTSELSKLKEQQNDLEQYGGTGSTAYQKLQSEIDDATRKLEQLNQKAVDTYDALGRPIRTQQYDAIQREIVDTSNRLKSLEEKAASSDVALSKLNENLKTISTGSSKVSKVFRPITTAIAGLGTAVVATVPATEELRRDLSKLDQNAADNAVSADAAREAWRLFAIQSGETDSSVEAVSNLLQAGFTESNLQKAVEGLAGAAQRFPDTLKIESLADSLQETIATGKATGQFAELLDRLGVGADKFSDRLASCSTEARKQNLVLRTLADAGLADTYEGWVKNNEEMIANQEANLKLKESLAGLAETVMPLITTVINKVSELINWFNGLDSGAQKLIAGFLGFVGLISPVAGAIEHISEVLPKLNKLMQSLGGQVGIVVLLIGTLVGLATAVAGAWNNMSSLERAASIFGLLAVAAASVAVALGALQGFAGAAITATAIAMGIAAVWWAVNSATNRAKMQSSSSKVPYLADGGTVYSGSAVVGEAGPELLTVGNGRAVVQPLTSNTTVPGSASGLGNVYNITIDASNVREFNDIVRIAENARQSRRAR